MDQIAATARAAVPPEFGQDVEKNVRAVLDSTFQRLRLVTREEFEVQQAVLQKTREMVERLERQVAELEAKNATGSGPAKKPPTAV
ncbi:accessory factor UbiK family protein [Acidiferrobacter sp.]|uniref:accessory factor UbiK family protein n=1 Tax=Acidiferrobacter sp. TaxID=1872107 RepID=UPI00260940CC|nr:accessory factor UbiK family protein [Acidiferrobacter sp.]